MSAETDPPQAPPDTFIRARVKIIDQRTIGEVYMTTFELMENIDEEAIMPQHFIIYTENQPMLGVGDQMGLKIAKGIPDFDGK